MGAITTCCSFRASGRVTARLRSGVIHTVSSTGGVITAAGVIFAASMYGMLFASISTLVQSGFVIGTGLLLDTFLVRTITVPAIAVLVGKSNWWPSKRAIAFAARAPGTASSARLQSSVDGHRGRPARERERKACPQRF